MNVSIVIPNYNGSKLLQKNLPKVIAKVSSGEIIVVDDGSTDGSVEEIKYQISKIKNTKQKAKLKLIKNEKNLGFASSVNIGVKQTTGNLILLLNTDVVPEQDFLTPLIKHFSDPKVFAVGCLQKCREDSQVVLRGRGIGKFARGFLVHSRGAVSDEDTSDGGKLIRLSRRSSDSSEVEDFRRTLWVSGGAGLFRKDIWVKLGGMCDLYNPFYWEDIDLSYRAQKAGYIIYFEQKSVICHNHQEGVIRGKFTPSQIKIIAYRNQIYFVWLNISSLYYLLEHLIFLPVHFIKSIIHLDFSFIQGLILALINLPKVLNHRYHNQKYNKITDEEILNKMLQYMHEKT